MISVLKRSYLKREINLSNA